MNNEFLRKEDDLEILTWLPPSLRVAIPLCPHGGVLAPVETRKDIFQTKIKHDLNQRDLLQAMYFLPIARILDLCLLKLSFFTLERDIWLFKNKIHKIKFHWTVFSLRD